MIAELRRFVRVLRVFLHILAGLPVALIAASSRHPERMAQFWFRGLIQILNLKLDIKGQRPAQAALLAGNHVSWLDIAVVVAAHPVIFVSKAEVARWPVIGWMARGGGTLFIERGGNGTAKLNQEIADRLERGHSVVIFPEGTTTRGESVRHFQARLFAGAIEARVPVQPFAIRFRESCAPYVGDDVMLWHLLRLLREPGLHATLHFGPLIPSGDYRKALAGKTQEWVQQQLDLNPA